MYSLVNEVQKHDDIKKSNRTVKTGDAFYELSFPAKDSINYFFILLSFTIPTKYNKPTK